MLTAETQQHRRARPAQHHAVRSPLPRPFDAVHAAARRRYPVRVMGHAHHFLSRLDRVSRPHVELALSLYRNHELLRYILDSVRLPSSAPRIAISLDDPENGPFLVVSREGRFITCLGAGMRATGLPVVLRGQLDGITSKLESHRARVAEREKLLGEEGELGDLMRRILDAGPDLSREELIALASLQPLLAREFLRLFVEVAIDSMEARAGILRILKKTDRLKPANDPLLHAYWKQFWATGHLAVLSALGGHEALGPLPEEEPPIEAILSMLTVRQGIAAVAFKGAWAAAKLGRNIVGYYKKLFVEAGSIDAVCDAGFSLFALAMRHQKLRAEIRKALARATVNAALDPLARALERMAIIGFDTPDKAERVHLEIGRKMLENRASVSSRSFEGKLGKVEDVPDALAMPYALTCCDDFLSEPKRVPGLLLMMPWVARAEPEDLYLPRSLVDANRMPWHPQRTLNLLRGRAAIEKVPSPKPEGPSRSGPCPCGSGKKYKRCCGDQRS
jgi:hypothetical protein